MRLKIMLLLLFVTLQSIGQVKAPDLLQNSKAFDSNPYLRHWATTIPGFKLELFKYQRQSEFEDIRCEAIDTTTPAFREYLGLYRPLLSYNPDSTSFLDFYSEEVSLNRVAGNKQLQVTRDVDQALSLTDVRRNNSCRIAFLGSSARIEEAEWISENSFICVGTIYNGKSFHPFIYFADTRTRKTFQYLPEGGANDRKKKYISPKWSKMAVSKKDL